MKLDEKSKGKIVHIAAISFLIIAIILFISVIFIAFEIDIDELLYGKGEARITVENNYDGAMKVKCYINGEKGQIETESHVITSGDSHTFEFEYIKSKKVSNVHICAWDSSLGYFVDYITSFYVFPEGKPLDLHAIINEDGDNITITKMPES